MKKWLIFALLLIAVSAYISSNLFSKTEDPFLCANCHALEYKNYLKPINNSDLPAHKEKGITCIECHSSPGVKSRLEAKKLLVDLQVVNYSLPVLNSLFQANFSFNKSFKPADFSPLKANCVKCHTVKKIR